MPETPFTELAFELRVYAQREVSTNLDVEVFLSSLPAGLTTSHRRLVADLRASAALIGEASMLLSLLAPHEAAVRALVTAHADQPGEADACLSGT